MYNPFSLEGKTILVTGASSGIGRGIALECSKMGAKLIITGRNEERLNSTLQSLEGAGHLSVVANLTNPEDMEALISKVENADGLVLAAGVNQLTPFKMLTRKKIDSIFETNLYSPVELLRLMLKKKKLTDGASVVAISSIGGVESFSFGASAYGGSKAALVSIMKNAAKELAPKVRINLICPGQINTPMNENIGISDEQYEEYRKSIPMQRFGEPEDIAYAAIYLLSDRAGWTTGTALIIDGGTTL